MRFINPDPLASAYAPQSLSPYSYSENSPVSKSDPSGLAVTDEGEGGNGASQYHAEQYRGQMEYAGSLSVWFRQTYYSLLRADRPRTYMEIDNEPVEASRGSINWGDAAEFLSYWPVVGVPASAALAVNDFRNGDFGSGALNLAAVVPLGKVTGRAGGALRAARATRPGKAAVKEESVAELIGRLAQEHADQGTEHLLEVLSEAERKAYWANPAGGSRFKGKGVHLRVNESLRGRAPDRFKYSTRGPDFTDQATGELFELTTFGQIVRHQARYASYGSRITYVPYTLP